ncbi:hypothetical protein F5Y16DRAFT_382031 [Xylariaceae sp. FL0255]|nr:hypothetical protein F5Y16DRAFT_382031 [Xylariaceae sp. FL0255]
MPRIQDRKPLPESENREHGVHFRECIQSLIYDRLYVNIEWKCNETLQLQRLAYEESGQRTRSKCLSAVPITSADQELGLLPIRP